MLIIAEKLKTFENLNMPTSGSIHLEGVERYFVYQKGLSGAEFVRGYLKDSEVPEGTVFWIAPDQNEPFSKMASKLKTYTTSSTADDMRMRVNPRIKNLQLTLSAPVILQVMKATVKVMEVTK